jgi:hypothetical protein
MNATETLDYLFKFFLISNGGQAAGDPGLRRAWPTPYSNVSQIHISKNLPGMRISAVVTVTHGRAPTRSTGPAAADADSDASDIIESPSRDLLVLARHHDLQWTRPGNSPFASHVARYLTRQMVDPDSGNSCAPMNRGSTRPVTSSACTSLNAHRWKTTCQTSCVEPTMDCCCVSNLGC